MNFKEYLQESGDSFFDNVVEDEFITYEGKSKNGFKTGEVYTVVSNDTKTVVITDGKKTLMVTVKDAIQPAQ
jgi:hypothetical protein